MASPSFCFYFLFFLLIITSNLIPSSSAQIQNKILSSFNFSDSPWRPNQTQILISQSSLFAAGFRHIPTSRNLFTFSIWYHNISVIDDIVWSANHNSPVNQSAELIITSSGDLLLNTSSGQNLWPLVAIGQSNCTELTLSDFGNLICGRWQSFDYPTDTILPNQNITGKTISSKNGNYKFVDSELRFNDSATYDNSVTGFLRLDDTGKIIQENGGQIVSADLGESRLRRLVLDDDGNLKLYSFNPNMTESTGWTIVWQAIYDLCRIYGKCGPNSICMNDNVNPNSTYCVCPPGFRRLPGDGPFTCQLKTRIVDPGNTKFLRLDYVNFSGGSNQTNTLARNFTICERRCLTKRNCLGFGFKYDGSQYCVLQLDKLLYGYWSPTTETAMFIRVDKSETDETTFTGMIDLPETACPVRISLPSPPEESNTTTRNIVIICTLFAAELISGVVFFWAFLRKYVKYRDMARTFGLEFLPAGGPKRFSYAELKTATKDFSNIIGRGGFGDVYKGVLTDHRVVAVKCLKNVTGGDAEFWAEVTIIARMHHLNLVRLWGFCAEKGQRILVYEYVSNGSLDRFLFHADQEASEEQEAGTIVNIVRKPLLDWNIRYRIALGVARAIAYLHEECLEWVLHCDIKPENILLGDDFCPKISDFGLSKLKKKEDMVSLSRIRGTRGYMAPEWIKMDPITPKADVYSFGMVLLEIVNGMRNYESQGSRIDSEDWYFPRWAFDKLYKENSVEDILDGRIKHCYDSELHSDMINRMVKTAMWCLQEQPEMRPSMGKVAKMLEGTVEIIDPKKPTIFFLGDD